MGTGIFQLVFFRAKSRYDDEMAADVKFASGLFVSSGTGEPVVTFPSIDLIATAGRERSIACDDRTIHVWGFSLDGSDAAVERCRAWLSGDERARAARFVRQEDQRRYLLAHGGLRAVLSCYVGLEPGILTFHVGPTGKPALADGSRSHNPLRFNLSHSHDRMLVAVAKDQEVGADLEQIRDKVEAAKLAERFYAPSERNRVASVTGLKQVHQFYRYWVAKEAVLKGQGVGLLSLPQCEILASDTASRAEVHLLTGETMQPGWTTHWLDCGPCWAGAVSAYGSNWIVRTMTRE
ncbi:MAG TPA: 4'-phosphopantetheinyl transferase superfamily protein [Nitrospira sp.]|nr:4'-phosphopantetheinyl transferase superfamily protein [Nitrospira sp.]